MILFGGLAFIIFCIVFAIIEFGLIMGSKTDTESGAYALVVLCLGLAVYYFGVYEKPDFPWLYLLIYVGASVLWLPVYWWLQLKKYASQIRQRLDNGEQINDIYSKHVRNGKVDIKNPPSHELVANTILSPFSIIVLVLEGAVRMLIDSLTSWANTVRKNISDKINSTLDSNE